MFKYIQLNDRPSSYLLEKYAMTFRMKRACQ